MSVVVPTVGVLASCVGCMMVVEKLAKFVVRIFLKLACFYIQRTTGFDESDDV
jgi:hypothetical protein